MVAGQIVNLRNKQVRKSILYEAKLVMTVMNLAFPILYNLFA